MVEDTFWNRERVSWADVVDETSELVAIDKELTSIDLRGRGVGGSPLKFERQRNVITSRDIQVEACRIEITPASKWPSNGLLSSQRPDGGVGK